MALQTHQQGFHFNAMGLESPEDKLRCKTEKIYYLSAEGSHLNSPEGPVHSAFCWAMLPASKH